ncbi:MAG TPA: PGPGW domain-containing protein [Burkholderiales bacterium]|nr:PGPGW domain-containing protein [Burkholderiales bacterium]
MFRQGWQDLKRGRPGRRFQDRYARRRQAARGMAGKCAFVCLGLLVLLAGIVLLPLPGPGMIIVAAGALLMAEGSRTMAKALDSLELRVRRAYAAWRSSPRSRPTRSDSR